MERGNEILVILSPGFAASESDTTCMPTQQQLVLALNKSYPHIQIVILTMEYPFQKTPYHWYGNLIIPMDAYKKGKLKRLFCWYDTWKTLLKLKRQYRITGLFSFWCSEGAMIGKYFGRRYGIRHLIWILGQDALKGNRYMPFIRPMARELVAMSSFLSNTFLANYGIKPAHIIPSGVDISLFDTTPVERDIDILGVGSLIPLKQYDVFIRVVKALVLQRPDLKAVLCGKGKEEFRLRELIHEYQLEDHIVLLGERPHGEVLQLMKRSKLFLHPSSYEGYGTVCLEALYSGAYVCSFCNPELAWVRNWYIAADETEMAELAVDILDDPSRNHRPILVHSMDTIGRRIMELLVKSSDPVRETNISYYDAIAEEYDGMLKGTGINDEIRRKVAGNFMEAVKDGWVLDFGGGTGLDMDWMADREYKVIFCEPSRGMRQKAMENGARLQNKTDQFIFLEDDRTDFTAWQHQLPFDCKMDGILMNFAVINSIANIDLLFNNISLVMRQGGHFFALVLHRKPAGNKKPEKGMIRVTYKQHQQLVYLYPEQRLREASGKWFTFVGSRLYDQAGFLLIHLVRN